MRHKKYFIYALAALLLFGILNCNFSNRKVPVLERYGIKYGDRPIKVLLQMKSLPEKTEYHSYDGSRDDYYELELMGVESELIFSYDHARRLASVSINTPELSEMQIDELKMQYAQCIEAWYKSRTLINNPAWDAYTDGEMSFEAKYTGATGEYYSIKNRGNRLRVYCFDCR